MTLHRKPASLIQALNYRTPSYSNSILYMFGGISLAALAILLASGIYLSQLYRPTPDDAYASIQHLITSVPLADFMRSLHFWVANLVVGLLLLHIARVFITGSYKKPRRLTWLSGLALFAVIITYIFLGTVMKWDQEGVEALGHLQESLNLFGITLGLTNAGVPVITQIYAWHISVLLLILIGLLLLHLLLIKLRGISSQAKHGAVARATAGEGSSTFLAHLGRLSGFSLLFLALAGLLSLVFPAPLGYKGVLDAEVTEPLWMFWPFFGLENIFGLKGLVWGVVIFFAFLALVPLIDRSPYLHFSKRKFILLLGTVMAATLIGLGAYSKIRPPETHLAEEEEGMTLMTEEARAGNAPISHDRLRSEAVYITPVLLVAGVAGVWLAAKPAKTGSKSHE